MKKALIIVVAALLTLALPYKAKAIEDPYPFGSIILSAHSEFVPGYGTNIAGEFVVADNWWKGHFSVGFMSGYNFRYITYLNGYYNHFTLLPKATYGVNIIKNLEVHVGALMGGCLQYWRPDNFRLCFELGQNVGARYRIFDNLYIEAETVFSYLQHMNYLNVGVTYVL